jgi:outer membrane receptor protein involved in Fe transport
MPSGVDSTMFATHKFVNPQTFTYRKVDAFRYRSTLTHTWNDNSKTIASIIYRDNTIGQNPNYRIKDDYKKVNGRWVGQKDLAHGEINESSFNSYAFIAQHKQNLAWKKANIIGGVSVDLSPSTYDAGYIRIKKDTVANKYVSYQKTDSVLTDYATRINNFALFSNYEFSLTEKLRVVASLRYDIFTYSFNNHLKPSAFSGSPDTVNHFGKLSPKLGFTYNLSNKTGIYANYSEGFVPPQVTEMYTGVKVPDIKPSVFYNYEVGGWMEIIKNKLSVDASAYRLNGTNEIISVKMDDGSTENRNAGKTSHRGIEFGVNAAPISDITIRFSGAYSKHEFVSFVEKGNSYTGNEMNNAPHWIHNAEIWYKPFFAKGLRLGAEWQKVGSYYMDPKNTVKYEGYDVVNLRAGYQFKRFEVWLNVMNAGDNYYSYISTKSTSYSYQLAEPRNYNLGVSYNFASLLKRNKTH